MIIFGHFHGKVCEKVSFKWVCGGVRALWGVWWCLCLSVKLGR